MNIIEVYEKIDTLNTLAWETSFTNLDHAHQLAMEALVLANQAQYQQGLAHNQAVFARIHHFKGENALAFTQILESISRFETIQVENTAYFHALGLLGTVYAMLGSYSDQLKTDMKMLALAEKLNRLDFQAWVLNNIGTYYEKIYDSLTSLDYYQKSLALSLETPNSMLTAGVYGNIAIQYYRLQQPETALTYASEGLKIAREIQNGDVEIFLLQTLGEIYTAMQSYDSALDYYRKGLAMLEKTPIQRYRLAILYNIGQIYLLQQDWQSAIAHFQQALQIALVTGAKKQLYECHERLAHAYELQGDVTNALFHHKEFHTLKEQLFNAQSAETINNLMVLHQTETARKTAEFYRVQNEMLEKLREQEKHYFESMNQMKDDLIHTASHDLKNPLSSIKNFTYLLRRHLPPDEQNLIRYLDRIEEQTEQMRLLITSLLDLAVLEADRSIEKQVVDLVLLLLEVLKDYETDAQQKQITLRVLLPPSPVLYTAHADHLNRVFQNLLSNALKYTPSGGRVTIRLWIDEQVIHIRFEDTGIGIPPQDLPHIFEKFYRVKEKQHQAAEGTGLGLAIVKEIIEQHGGSINVSSVVNQGSQFEVRLPLTPPAP